ncbi:hypothetical protein JTB14_023798 [Gonioctena quinquepunctata]|nr:hypothetical protein JTB14_023798 [Gonioctena quinquepunctata]
MEDPLNIENVPIKEEYDEQSKPMENLFNIERVTIKTEYDTSETEDINKEYETKEIKTEDGNKDVKSEIGEEGIFKEIESRTPPKDSRSRHRLNAAKEAGRTDPKKEDGKTDPKGENVLVPSAKSRKPLLRLYHTVFVLTLLILFIHSSEKKTGIMTDEEVIKRRLIFDGDGTGDDRRFNLIKQRDVRQNPGPAELDRALPPTSELITKSNDEQLIKYQNLYAGYEQKITDIKEEIAKQRIELEKAKTIKQNRIQYDLLARGIAAEPPRKEMNKQLVSLQKQLKDLGEEKRRLVQKLDKRKKQFHVLSTSANQLQVYLNEDDANADSEMNTSLDDVNTNSPEPMSE